MKNIFLKAASVGAAFLSFSYASAQTASDTSALRTVYFSVGGKQVNISSLNERLAANNYPQFKNFFTSSGIGFQESDNRWVTNLDFSFARMQEHHSTDRVFSMMDFQLNANFGYEVFKTESFTFYPTVGFGGGAQYLSITARRNFDEILANPVEQSVTLWNNNFLLNAALNADYMISAGETPNNRLRFIALGLRGGYTFAPWSEWRQNNSMVDVGNSPGANMTGAFVQVKIGVSTKAKN